MNVTKETTNMELASRIAQEIKGRGEHNIYRFRLKGMRDPEIDFDLEQLASHYRICEILDDSEPVSYTHLDVYKRQLTPYLYSILGSKNLYSRSTIRLTIT